MFGHQHPAEFQTVEKASGQMGLIPIVNERAKVTEEREQLLVLEVDLNYHGVAKTMSKLVKASQVRCVQLDGMSLEVYRLIAPGVTVEQMVDTIMERHLLSFFEARGLVFWFLQLLAERGVIAIGVPDHGDNGSTEAGGAKGS